MDKGEGDLLEGRCAFAAVYLFSVRHLDLKHI